MTGVTSDDGVFLHVEETGGLGVAAADVVGLSMGGSVASWYAAGPAQVQFRRETPRGWAEFAGSLAGRDPLGAALTMRGVRAARPSLYDLDLTGIRAPATPPTWKNPAYSTTPPRDPRSPSGPVTGLFS